MVKVFLEYSGDNQMLTMPDLHKLFSALAFKSAYKRLPNSACFKQRCCCQSSLDELMSSFILKDNILPGRSRWKWEHFNGVAPFRDSPFRWWKQDPSHNQTSAVCFGVPTITKSVTLHSPTELNNPRTRILAEAEEKWRHGALHTGTFQPVWGYYRFDYWVPRASLLKWGLTASEGSEQLEDWSPPEATLRSLPSPSASAVWSVIKARLMKSWWR